MAYKFISVLRKITTGFSPGMKYLAMIFRSGNVEPQTAVERIVKHSNMSKAAVVGVMVGIEDLLIEAAEDGKAVKLPYIGTFIPSIEATAMDTAEEVDASTIKRYTMRFYPSVNMNKRIKSTSGEKQSLDMAGIQLDESGSLTFDQYNRLQKEQLKKDGLLDDIEASEDGINSLNEPEKD